MLRCIDVLLTDKSVDTCIGQASIDMDISMDIHAKFVDMDMDGKFHIHATLVISLKTHHFRNAILFYFVRYL